MKKLLLVLGTLFLTTTGAEARTLPWATVTPNDPNDPVSCYRWFPAGSSTVGLTRTCAGTFAVDLGLPADTGGNKFVTIYARRPTTTSQVSCNLWTVTPTGGYSPGTVVDLKGAANTWLPIVLPAQNLAEGSTMFVRCLMRQSTQLLFVDYNE